MVTYRNFPWVHEFRDRHGKTRRYFRRPGFKRVTLLGEPGTVTFAESYQAALDGATKTVIGATRTTPGSVSAAIVGYYGSAAFNAMATGTQRAWRNQLERFRAEHGDKAMAGLRPEHVDKIVASKMGTPAAARNFLKALRSLVRYCIQARVIGADPTAAIKLPALKSAGFRSWTDEDIARFEARHPLGSRARLALALLLCTAQRRSDIVRMGRQHVSGGFLEVRQQKTGAKLAIPMHADLIAAIDAMPGDNLTFLTAKGGKPFSPAGFTNWFRDMCNEAGLPNGTSAHGLRKAACRRLAEAGCSANEIAAVSGHATLSEVARYTKAVDQKRLASAALGRLTPLPKRTEK